jgi:hypothetical protein
VHQANPNLSLQSLQTPFVPALISTLRLLLPLLRVRGLLLGCLLARALAVDVLQQLIDALLVVAAGRLLQSFGHGARALAGLRLRAGAHDGPGSTRTTAVAEQQLTVGEELLGLLGLADS